MAQWSLDDVPWQDFDPAKVDAELLRIAKAAAMVEYNAPDYVRYLGRVFRDDAETLATIEQWGVEEIQHGAALGRWAQMADPSFDFEAAFRKFTSGYKLQLDVEQSIRGTRTGEMIARCMVETGTSSFYAALADSAEEPVLRFICRKISSDELRHFKLFYSGARRYQARENLGFWRRLSVAAGRIFETEDDELAYAYYAANGNGQPYERKRWNRSYVRRAYAVYRRHHIDRAISMIMKAVGIAPHGKISSLFSLITWAGIRYRLYRIGEAA
ncbi:MAG TPA: ferritin-like domain-containing protein [Stellaceae bacterium]|jgi:rubrerythrin|nr:ferritin-like domain-containing protein [Stellaceae bacterium]